MKKIFFITTCLLTQLTNTIHSVGLPQYTKQHQQTFTDFCKQEICLTPARMVGGAACGLFAGAILGFAKGIEIPSKKTYWLLMGSVYGSGIGLLSGLLIPTISIALKISDTLFLRVFAQIKNNAFAPLKIIKQCT